MKQLTLLIMVLVFILNQGFAQKKYAIIFGSEHKPEHAFISKDSRFNQQEAIWNDTYLTWELLLNKGFDNDDIFVLYHTGLDYTYVHQNALNKRYNPQLEHSNLFPGQHDQLNRGMSTKANMKDAIEALYNSINTDDVLFIFNFSHGWRNRILCNNFHYSNPSTYITPDNLKDWLEPINCKKVLLMQQCFGGSFIDELAGPNTLIMTATNDTSRAAVADKIYFEYDYETQTFGTYPHQALEFETYGSNPHEHIHSEWFLHWYAALNQAMPNGDLSYETSYSGFSLSESDLNNDGIISFREAHLRTEYFDSEQDVDCPGHPFYGCFGDDPQLSDQGYLAKTTSLEYINMLTADIDFTATMKGTIDVVTPIYIKSGHTLTIDENAILNTHPGSSITIEQGGTLVLKDNAEIQNNSNLSINNYGTLKISGNFNLKHLLAVKNSGTLRIAANQNLTLSANAVIDIESNATLIIENNATIKGNGSRNKINLAGNLQIGTGVSFGSTSSSTFGGFNFNSGKTYSFTDCNFNNTRFTGLCYGLDLNNTNFQNSIIHINNGSNLAFDNCTLTYTPFVFQSNHKTSRLTINACNISNSPQNGISISGISHLTIKSSKISNNNKHGIYLSRTGGGDALIIKNLISNNTRTGYAGIQLYNSFARISDNLVQNNYYGIMCLNSSEAEIIGNPQANYTHETQQIINNTKYQIYATSTSFPTVLKYNHIDNSGSGNYKVYCTGIGRDPYRVMSNYWGKFNAGTDLYPNSSLYYTYLPLWNLTEIISPEPLAGRLYNQGVALKQEGDFAGAESTFKRLVNEHTQSNYALSALKQLPTLTDNNQSKLLELKSYLLNNNKIQGNPLTAKLADRLANQCNVELENYPEAVAWFEGVILNPESLEDSVFAIIDLAYTYFLMGNDNKAAHTGKLTQYRFESYPKFQKVRKALIDELLNQELPDYSNLVEYSRDEIFTEEQAQVIKNKTAATQTTGIHLYPNPLSNQAKIVYAIDEDARVCIRLYEYSGKEVAVLVHAQKQKGTHELNFKRNGLKSGIYFYTFEVNGTPVSTKSMVITK